jgi:hypothetical protein
MEKDKLKQVFDKVLRENEQNRTMDIIFSELEEGLGKLYIAIEKYNHFFEGSEIKNKIRIKESTEGDLLKEQIILWTNYIQERINELRDIVYTEFNITVSANRTRNINRYSINIYNIKTDILSDNKVEANKIIKPPESNEIYRQCLSYTNLIDNLNEIIDRHNKYFQRRNRTDQVIDLVWNNF